jgi:hypothetical protein
MTFNLPGSRISITLNQLASMEKTVLSERKWSDIKSGICVRIRIRHLHLTILVNVFPHFKRPTYLCDGDEDRICGEMFTGTNSSSPPEGGGCFICWEGFCVGIFWGTEEATGIKCMWIGIVYGGMVDCPEISWYLRNGIP